VRAVLQRVTAAAVSVDGQTVGEIGLGLMILVCAMQGDTDDAGKMNLSVKDVGGAALIVSQFTLAADLRGNRPGFSPAASPADGKRLYDHFTARMAAEGIPTANGIFGADMDVTLTNQGPVTIWMDTDQV
jgi:D-aminoacyl-tRNA deacylase